MTFSGYWIRASYFTLGLGWGGAFAGDWTVLTVSWCMLAALVLLLVVKSVLDLRAKQRDP